MCDHSYTSEVRIVAPALGQFCATYSPLRLRVGRYYFGACFSLFYVCFAVMALTERTVLSLIMYVLLTGAVGVVHAYASIAIRRLVGTYRITRYGVVFAPRDGPSVELEWCDISTANVGYSLAVLQGCRGRIEIPVGALGLSRSESKALRRLIRERLRGVGCDVR